MITHWCTPLYVGKYPRHRALNAQLLRLTAELSKRPTSGNLSNVGVWRSPPDFLLIQNAAVNELKGIIFAAISALSKHVYGNAWNDLHADFLAEAWVNVYKNGDYQTTHVHHGATWSGVYFVSSGIPTTANAGSLEFYDPRARSFHEGANGSVFTHSVKAIQGRVVVFPSWLRHAVTPFYGKNSRVSIAFNCRNVLKSQK